MFNLLILGKCRFRPKQSFITFDYCTSSTFFLCFHLIDQHLQREKLNIFSRSHKTDLLTQFVIRRCWQQQQQQQKEVSISWRYTNPSVHISHGPLNVFLSLYVGNFLVQGKSKTLKQSKFLIGWNCSILRKKSLSNRNFYFTRT